MKTSAVKATGNIHYICRCVCVCVKGNNAIVLINVVLSPLVEGLSLLGAYEDSDDEDGDSHGSTVKPQLNQSNDIDSTLANFMAVSIICCVSCLFVMIT